MKSLDSLLDSLRLRSMLHNRVLLLEPWGVTFPSHPDSAKFHFVEEGGGYLVLPWQKPVKLEQGDLAIVFAGDHSVQDVRLSEPTDVRTLVERAQVVCRSGITLQFGGDGPLTSIISGVFHFDQGS